MKKTLIITSLFFLLLLGWFLLPGEAAEDANNQVIVESITQLTFNGTGGYRPDWSPDGKKIAFPRNGTIWIINSDGTDMKQLTSNIGFNDFPKWSHDGKKFLFTSRRNDIIDGNYPYEVWLMNSDGSDQKFFWQGLGASWTPEDRISFLGGNSKGDFVLITVNLNYTDKKEIFSKPFNFEMPSWSPDGTKIAFADNRSGNWNIYVINADGSNEQQLTEDMVDEWWPSWNPDGTKIVYNKFVRKHFDENGREDYDIMAMNNDGSNKIRLNKEDGFQLFPSWSPDGNKIVFVKYSEGKGDDIWVMNLKSAETPVTTTGGKSTPGFESLFAMVCIGAITVLRK
ncbi:MAG: DPP IV N-terminal domain-containing protein [Candidatus Methanoperedens sp.]|nr:DPP IV N-terminal domain-containing protein [Candidatus Methanoperedens sp.]MCZ7404322.1 DPP IV N-terminal domain-containing protein [Candidatus Methanoperedens sp.]